jgi:hypothetical protein
MAISHISATIAHVTLPISHVLSLVIAAVGEKWLMYLSIGSINTCLNISMPYGILHRLIINEMKLIRRKKEGK